MRCLIVELQCRVRIAGTHIFIETSHLGLQEGHNKITRCIIIIQFGLTMQSQNTNAALSQKDLLPTIKKYLGSVLFRHAHQYEIVTNNHAKFLDFSMQKVPLAEGDILAYDKVSVQALLLGQNHKQWLNLQLLRIMQYQHVLICLTVDQLEPLSKNKTAILAIVFPSNQSALKWGEQNTYLAILQIKSPYKSIHKVYGSLPLVLTCPDNIIIQQRYKIASTPQGIKNEANSKFRQSNFQQALLIYQIGLGLMVDSQTRRERAVLYANSSQCLYEMRLFESALLYAETAVSLDRTYVKGYFRKLNSLLELDIMEVPKVISAISLVATPSQVQEAHLRYTKYMLNYSGIFNWIDVFQSPTPVFGQFTLDKLRLKKMEKGELYLKADQKINQFQLILVNKPLVYKKSQQEKIGGQQTMLTQQIQTSAIYDELFSQRFQNLPCQSFLNQQSLIFERSTPNKALEIGEINKKFIRCLEREKPIENVAASSIQNVGIWEKLYAFKQECLANCSYLHIRGVLVVFALTDIDKDEILTIDSLNWQTLNRQTLMKEKLGKTCECGFCCLQWQYFEQTATPEMLYQFLETQKQMLQQRVYDKIKLYLMWELIYSKRYRQFELMKQYLIILQRYPIWECVMNCLRYLRSRSQNDLFGLIKATLKRIFQKYFKINHHQAVNLLKFIL